MGTSSSSKGSPGNVPMVPPWVPPVPPLPPPDAATSPEGMPPDAAPADAPIVTNVPAALPALSLPPIRLAPAGRFAAARSSAGHFAATGSGSDLKRSMRHYIRKGYGGAETASQRFGGTANNAGALYSVLTPGQPGAGLDSGARIDRTLLAGRTASEIMDAVIEAVGPADGTQDAEASRKAIRGCLSEILERYPDANLLELSEEQRAFAVERYVALDVFQRYALDLGKTIQDKAPSPSAVLSRLKDVKEYIRETVSASFRKLKTAGQNLSAGRIAQIVQGALLDAFQVFERNTV
ncbi:hypothetical protein A1D31_35895 [Bradyrhizobium liaoningense]|nr:hypothetical protein A1D31_35895 [Bradyrhizobium liaoningense]